MSKNIITLQNKKLARDKTIFELLTQERKSGPVTAQTIALLADRHQLPVAWIRGVAEFYDNLNPNVEQRSLLCCNGEACRAAGASELKKQLAATSNAPIGSISCVGLCAHAPAAMVADTPVSLADSATLQKINEYFFAGTPATFTTPTTKHYQQPTPVTQHLLPIIKNSRDNINMENHGYQGLKTAQNELTAESLRQLLGKSGLRGRGGAGFPTADKLDIVATAPVKDGSNRRFVVINADEGDPGSYIDKELMECAPHLIIEGALLAAFAVKATAIYFYIRHEYPHAWRQMRQAIEQVQEADLGVINGRRCSLHMVKGQGAYICGEETSLLRSIEGLPAQASIRPPYPAQEGLYGCPTAVQNVETIANLPIIIAKGAENYAGVGSNKSSGTKLISLNSSLQRPGLYEAPFGTPIRTIIENWAGGVAPGRYIQGVQIGGPLGAILPPELLDTPLSFEDLAAVGGTLGHGSMVVFDDRVDLMQIAHGIMAFGARESCGKCFPCRLGSVRGAELLRQIRHSGVNAESLQLLKDLCETMSQGSLCGLGAMLPTPIESLMEFFPHLWQLVGGAE